MSVNEYQPPKRSIALGKPPVLRVFNWLTLASLAVFLYGALASRYGLHSVELDAMLQKSFADIDSITLSLSLVGLCWNIIYIKQSGASYWSALTLIPFWSLLIYLGSSFF